VGLSNSSHQKIIFSTLLRLSRKFKIPYSEAGFFVKRLFSSFAHGRPGIGLLIIRLAAGATVIVAGVTRLLAGPSLALAISHVLAIAGGSLLVLGLWTPIAGFLLVIVQMWSLFLQPGGEPWTRILLAALGAGLALLGPGAFSIDARLFGWKRIDLGDRAR
jgi:putative oxidoreductase